MTMAPKHAAAASTGKSTSTGSAAAHAPAASKRADISPFLVMDVMRAANQRQQRHGDTIHMEVGQPACGAPQAVLDAARHALRHHRLDYTEALGIQPLRARIARHYAESYGVFVEARHVVITTGSSAGFILAFLAAFDPGAEIATQVPGYPCYRNILKALGLTARPIIAGAESRYVPSPGDLQQAHDERPLSGFLVASPANPTGTMIAGDRLQALAGLCQNLGLWMISDEIYHGLSYFEPAMTALAYNPDAIVINSFSKYYAMTGWRIGWMVVPERLLRPIERLAQNLFISPPALSQYASLAAFDAGPQLQAIKTGYALNRAVLLDGLRELGITEIMPADGAFYGYCNVAHLHDDSSVLAQHILAETGIAVTPGTDFDPLHGRSWLRFCYAGSQDEVREAVRRLKDRLPALAQKGTD